MLPEASDRGDEARGARTARRLSAGTRLCRGLRSLAASMSEHYALANLPKALPLYRVHAAQISERKEWPQRLARNLALLAAVERRRGHEAQRIRMPALSKVQANRHAGGWAALPVFARASAPLTVPKRCCSSSTPPSRVTI